MGVLFRSYSDNDVISLIRKGGRDESKAVTFLLKKNESPVYSYVLKNNGNKDAAQTILIEGVTELILNIRSNKFRGDSSVNTYLFAICKSLWLKQLKKDQRHTDLDEKSMASVPVEDITQTDDEEIKRGLRPVLEQVGQDCKKVLELWSVHHSMSEIAEIMGYKNAQIAMNKKNRCLTRLKSMVMNSTQLSEQLLNYMS